MGGRNSIDKLYRLPGRSWWPWEMLSQAEYAVAMENLEKRAFQVDYIITHAAPESQMNLFYPDHEDELPLNLFLQRVMDWTSCKKWFFGHLHEDRTIDERHRTLYQDVVQIPE